jgi:Protein of unknown function (DUF1573)/Peptidase C39 family
MATAKTRVIAGVFACFFVGASAARTIARDNLCGAECLYIALRALNSHQLPPSFSAFVKTHPPSSKAGYSLAMLFDIAERNGVNAKLLQLSSEQLIAVADRYQVILHLSGPSHFILCEEAKPIGVKAFDPESRSVFLSSRQLQERWKGNCLVLSNSPIKVPSGYFGFWNQVTGWIAIACCIVLASLSFILWLRRNRYPNLLGFVLLASLLSAHTGCVGHVADDVDTILSSDGKFVVLGDSHRDVGEVQHGDVLEAVFLVKNEALSPLHIDRLKPSCSCALASAIPQVIGPNETGTIKLIVDTKKSLLPEASTLIISNHGSVKVKLTWKYQEGLFSIPSIFPIMDVSAGGDAASATRITGIDLGKEIEVVTMIEKNGLGIEHSASIDGDVCKVLVHPGDGTNSARYEGYVDVRYKGQEKLLLRIPWIVRVSVPMRVVPKELSFRPSTANGFFESQFVVQLVEGLDPRSICVETIPTNLASLVVEKTFVEGLECVIDIQISAKDLNLIETLSVRHPNVETPQELSISRFR